MKYILLLLLIPISLFASELKVGDNVFKYELGPEWKINKSNSTEGIKVLLFKREAILDHKNIEVIPNLLIQVFAIESNLKSTDNPDSNIAALDRMTLVALLNNAPPIVLKEYEESKKVKGKYKLPHKLSYNFVSNYKDNFDEIHDCHYITMLLPNKIGVFIMIDSTQDVFKKIDKEILAFINSLSLM